VNFVALESPAEFPHFPIFGVSATCFVRARVCVWCLCKGAKFFGFNFNHSVNNNKAETLTKKKEEGRDTGHRTTQPAVRETAIKNCKQSLEIEKNQQRKTTPPSRQHFRC